MGRAAQVTEVNGVMAAHCMVAIDSSIALSDLTHVGSPGADGAFKICERCMSGPDVSVSCTADAADPAYTRALTRVEIEGGRGVAAARARRKASDDELLARGRAIAEKLEVGQSRLSREIEGEAAARYSASLSV